MVKWKRNDVAGAARKGLSFFQAFPNTQLASRLFLCFADVAPYWLHHAGCENSKLWLVADQHVVFHVSWPSTDKYLWLFISVSSTTETERHKGCIVWALFWSSMSVCDFCKRTTIIRTPQKHLFFMEHKGLIIWLLILRGRMGMDFVWKKVRKTDSVFVHSSGVHAYFSVIWVFVYFVLLCGLFKAVILDFLSS